MTTDDGCWADYRIVRTVASGTPCLFLDRDGVLIEDTGYPRDAAKIAIIQEMLEVVRIANAGGFVVGVVSNQSGIGRGYFGWEAFAAIQGVIDRALATRGGHIDFVLACPHHPEAALPSYQQKLHPWRKPAPGMLAAAVETLGLDVANSIMIGDRASDMAAAAAAGVPHRVLLADSEAELQRGTWTTVRRNEVRPWFAAFVTDQQALRAASAAPQNSFPYGLVSP